MSSWIFRTPRKMKSDNQNIIGEKCILNDQSELAPDNDTKVAKY